MRNSLFFRLPNFHLAKKFFFENLPVLPYRFSKINPSFFTIKEGSTSLLGLLPSGKKRKPLLPVALNRYALRLAGHQSPRQGGCAGWDRIAESLAESFTESLAESLAESGGIRGLVRVVLAGMNPQGEDLLKLLGGMGPQGAISGFQVHPLHRRSGFEGLWLHSP